MDRILKLGTLFFLLFVCFSCKQENKQDSAEMPDTLVLSEDYLKGEWNIVKGKRGGLETKLLNDVYFTFRADSVFTDFPSLNSPSIYNIQEQKIILDNLTFDVDLLSRNEMKFFTVIQSYDFELILNKSNLNDEE